MKTNKFKQDLINELNKLNGIEAVIEYLMNQNAFNNTFKNTISTEDMTDYEVVLNKDKKVQIDITKNKVFSCYDTDEELKNKMKTYIRNEEYEKAEILKNYFDIIEFR